MGGNLSATATTGTITQGAVTVAVTGGNASFTTVALNQNITLGGTLTVGGTIDVHTGAPATPPSPTPALSLFAASSVGGNLSATATGTITQGAVTVAVTTSFTPGAVNQRSPCRRHQRLAGSFSADRRCRRDRGGLLVTLDLGTHHHQR